MYSILDIKSKYELYTECTKALNEVIKDIEEKILTLKTKEEEEFLNDLLKVLEENSKES